MWFLTILKANWKWIVIGLVLIVAYFKITNWYDDYKQAKLDQAREVIELALNKQAAEISVEALRSTLNMMQEQQRKTEVLLLDALQRQDVIRAEAKEQIDIFEKHDFKALTDAKPGLIEGLANKATNQRMEELENALND